MTAIVWRRLDVPGHDSCRLDRVADGFRLDGMAAYLEGGAPAQLAYQLSTDAAWRTTGGLVRGWIGDRRVDLTIVREPDGPWWLNGAVVAGLDRLVDLDFGFTPATNLPQLKRLALAIGQAADLRVAWLDPATGTGALTMLPQRYERRSATAYWYESPTTSYRATLEVLASGFIRRYPGLWEAEAPGEA